MHDFNTVPELMAELKRYFHFYNHLRIHQSLAYATPAEVHFAEPVQPAPIGDMWTTITAQLPTYPQ